MPPPLKAIPDSDDDIDNALDLDVPAQELETGNAARVTEQSTGSTERMARDIRDAERDLLAATADPVASVAHSSGSPDTAGGHKRRHSDTLNGTPSASAEKRLKRSKTSKPTTYGKTKPRSSASNSHEENAFASLRDDVDAVATLRSAKFSKHSSSVLPAGTIRADFANHEPNIMFSDSGSTAVDASSEQQRMVEQARSDAKKMSTSASKLIESDAAEEQKSSSFPWTASAMTPAVPDKTVMRPEPTTENGPDPSNDGAGNETSPAQEERVDTAEQPTEKLDDAPIPDDEPDRDPETANDNATALPKVVVSIPRSSPRVEIALPTEPIQSPHDTAAAESPQRTIKARKRKAKEPSSGALNSEDREVREHLRAAGLEKERYVPRPSKRRSTQIAEEPIDFSVAPEKAARAKRTKTTGGLKAAKIDKTLTAIEPIVPASAKPTKAVDPVSMAAPASPMSHEIEKRQTILTKQSLNSEVPTGIEPGSSPIKDDNQAPVKSTAESPTKELKDDEAFVKPMLKSKSEAPAISSPVKELNDGEIVVKTTPKPKSTAKAKRSHTTIFEDHVDFGSSQRTPSLSQQQAKRKDALKPIDNSAPLANQRKRRKIVQDDEDDEDELGAAAADDQEDTFEPAIETEKAPKKRGRGRPPKKASADPSVTEQLLEKVDADPDETNANVDDAPKKPGRKRRGTGSKPPSTEPAQTQGTNEKAQEAAEDVDVDRDDASKATRPLPAATQEPTPSPDKVVKVKAAMLPKSSPTSHSPLKSSSAAPLRVGLNRRQRIAPLLRFIKPVKR